MPRHPTLLTRRERCWSSDVRSCSASCGRSRARSPASAAASEAPGARAVREADGAARRGGTRADQAVKIIGENPGIGVSELGKKMKLKAPNYLYRVLPDLEKEGRIKKKGRGYFPG